MTCVSRCSVLNSYRFSADTAQVFSSSIYQVAPAVCMNVQKPLPRPWWMRTCRIARGRPDAAADREVKLLEMPRERALGEEVADAKGAATVRTTRRVQACLLIDNRQKCIHTDKSPEKLRVRDPNHTGYGGVSEGIEGRPDQIYCRRSRLTGRPVEEIVVADINPWRWQGCALDAFRSPAHNRTRVGPAKYPAATRARRRN